MPTAARQHEQQQKRSSKTKRVEGRKWPLYTNPDRIKLKPPAVAGQDGFCTNTSKRGSWRELGVRNGNMYCGGECTHGHPVVQAAHSVAFHSSGCCFQQQSGALERLGHKFTTTAGYAASHLFPSSSPVTDTLWRHVVRDSPLYCIATIRCRDSISFPRCRPTENVELCIDLITILWTATAVRNNAVYQTENLCWIQQQSAARLAAGYLCTIIGKQQVCVQRPAAARPVWRFHPQGKPTPVSQP